MRMSNVYSGDRLLTVDDSQDAPQQEQHDDCGSLLPLWLSHSLGEHEVKDEWRHNDHCVEYLQQTVANKLILQLSGCCIYFFRVGIQAVFTSYD